MSPDAGGIFDPLLTPVKRGLGGTAGDGRQFVSWIHFEDFVRAIDWLIVHQEIEGVVNVAAPHPSRHNAAYWARRHTRGSAPARTHTTAPPSARGTCVSSMPTSPASRWVSVPLPGARRSTWRSAFEAVALGLRRIDGIRRSEVIAEFGEDPLERDRAAVDEVVRAGLLEVDGDRVRLTDRGRLLASEVLLAFMPEATARR